MEARKLRAQLSKLSEANLRISENLDVNAVLQEVVAGTCALIIAGYGGITTTDSSGNLQDFASHDLSPACTGSYWTCPSGLNCGSI